MTSVLSDEQLLLMDAYWRAANYISVGQIYLLDNSLLKAPLKIEHIKPRLLGHHPGTELRLRASQPSDQALRSEHDLCVRARTRRAWDGGKYVP